MVVLMTGSFIGVALDLAPEFTLGYRVTVVGLGAG